MIEETTCCICPAPAKGSINGVPVCDSCRDLSRAQAATAKKVRQHADKKARARRYARLVWPKKEAE